MVHKNNIVKFFIPINGNLSQKATASPKFKILAKHMHKIYYVLDKIYISKFLDKTNQNQKPEQNQNQKKSRKIYRHTNTSYELSFFSENSTLIPEITENVNEIVVSENSDKLAINLHDFHPKTNGVKKWSKLSDIEKYAKNTTYARLNFSTLKKVLGTRHTKLIIEFLLSERVIETDGYYIPGDKSKAYRLTYTYKTAHEIICNNKTFTERIIKLKKERLDNIIKTKDILEYLYMVMFKIKFDVDKFQKLILEMSSDLSDESLDSLIFNVNKIIEQDFYYEESSATGRIFTNFTNLKSEFRSCILDENGESMIEIDIANSQPFFLSMFCKTRYDTNDMPYEVIEPDLKHFIELCSNGLIYNYLSDKLGMTRDKTKLAFLTMLFGSRNWTSPVKTLFKNEFPSVYKVIEFHSGKSLANNLQLHESDLVIGSVACELASKKINVITIHDSIMVGMSHATEALEIFRQCFINIHGVCPMLKIK